MLLTNGRLADDARALRSATGCPPAGVPATLREMRAQLLHGTPRIVAGGARPVRSLSTQPADRLPNQHRGQRYGKAG